MQNQSEQAPADLPHRPASSTRSNQAKQENQEAPSSLSQRLEKDIIAKFQEAGLSEQQAQKKAKSTIAALDDEVKGINQDERWERSFDSLVEFLKKEGYTGFEARQVAMRRLTPPQRPEERAEERAEDILVIGGGVDERFRRMAAANIGSEASDGFFNGRGY